MTVTIVLCGGALDGTSATVLDEFRTPAAARPGRVVAVLADRDGSAERHAPAYADAFGADVVVIHDDHPLDLAAFDGAAGIVVGGGHTPRYHTGLVAAFPAIRARVAAGAPYLGFSAGAMIAGERALLGGHLIGDLEVVHEDCSEDLGPLTVAEGLGLIPGVVDVHAAQAGTLTRAIATVEHGLAERAAAVDEDTAIVIGDPHRVVGSGSAWWVTPSGSGVQVVRQGA